MVKEKEKEREDAEESQEVENLESKDDTEEQAIDKESDKDVKKERDRLKDLGVSNTWDCLTSSDKKKKEPDKKTAFRGFK